MQKRICTVFMTQRCSSCHNSRLPNDGCPTPKHAGTPEATSGASATNATNGTDLTPEQLRIPFIPGTPNASWPTAQATVSPSSRGRQIPKAFLATSHEWLRMTDYGGENVQAFANIFKMLGPQPVLRIGGSSQDLMADLPGPEVWAALKRLHQATNCK
jgi:hypothetical protein